jgi:hypothetical protein
MKIYEGELDMKAQAVAYFQKLSAAAASNETNNLFRILEQADRTHHDALVELTGDMGPEKTQFLQGAACLFKTTPGKA